MTQNNDFNVQIKINNNENNKFNCVLPEME